MSAYGKVQTINDLSRNSRTAVFTVRPGRRLRPPSTHYSLLDARYFGFDFAALWDPRTGKYSVAGGSALPPTELDSMTTYAVDTQQEHEGYSDVGFRLAFSVPDSLVGKAA